MQQINLWMRTYRDKDTTFLRIFYHYRNIITNTSHLAPHQPTLYTSKIANKMIAEGEANPQRGGGCCLFLGGGMVAQPARREE